MIEKNVDTLPNRTLNLRDRVERFAVSICGPGGPSGQD